MKLMFLFSSEFFATPRKNFDVALQSTLRALAGGLKAPRVDTDRVHQAGFALLIKSGINQTNEKYTHFGRIMQTVFLG